MVSYWRKVNTIIIYVPIRNLHINGIDELLLFLGSNPNEVYIIKLINILLIISIDTVVYACFRNSLSSLEGASTLKKSYPFLSVFII